MKKHLLFILSLAFIITTSFAQNVVNTPNAEDLQKLETNINGYTLNETALSATQQSLVDEKIVLLKQYPSIKIYLLGHTCNIGTVDTNEKIGLQRAEYIKGYMIQNGIDSNRIKTISRSFYEPDVPNTNEENRRINRRVVTDVEKPIIQS